MSELLYGLQLETEIRVNSDNAVVLLILSRHVLEKDSCKQFCRTFKTVFGDIKLIF